jgi:hypothetical protein
MLIVSSSATTLKSVVADRRPAARSACTSAEAHRGWTIRPLDGGTLRGSTSIPVQVRPLRANSIARGSPT